MQKMLKYLEVVHEHPGTQNVLFGVTQIVIHPTLFTKQSTEQIKVP